jgi:hypothetical protein
MSGLYHPPPDASSPFRERLLHPRWAALEAALGRPVPGVLRDLTDHQRASPGANRSPPAWPSSSAGPASIITNPPNDSMITLDALGAWEDRLLRELGRPRGSLEDRDSELTRSGLYAEYAAVFGGYADLARDAMEPAERLEALKRAVFLTWYEGAQPAPLTGLAELPELAVRRTLELLEERCRQGMLDPELEWMLPWYHAVAEHSLLRLPGLRYLETRLGALDPAAWRAAGRPDRLEGRGAMGRYWASLRRAV